MAETTFFRESPDRLLALSAQIGNAETAEAAGARAVEFAETAFDRPAASVYEYDRYSETVTELGPAASSSGADGDPGRIPGAVVERLDDPGTEPSPDVPEATVDTDPPEPLEAEALVPVGHRWILRLGVTDPDALDRAGVALVEGIAANLEVALARIERRQSAHGPATANEAAASDTTPGRQRAEDVVSDTSALRRLNELTVDATEFDATIERLLSLGCDHFGLDTGILSRVDGDDYEVEAVVDASDTHEAGSVYDVGETMCEVTLASRETEPLAFADVADTDHEEHPAAETVRAYIAAPVVVGGEPYGTVNFSMAEPRGTPFRHEEREFVTLVARWIGTEIGRRRRVEELQRYETILEAVGDPVYALDADGQFTFLNDAAKREFGYGTEILGDSPTVGMDESDVEQIENEIEELLGTDERTTTTEFGLETADGETKTVENRLALIGDGEFRGTAGVLRDVTDRNERLQRLQSFQQAIEDAADGIAVLDDEEYIYVDQSHVDMYGFESKDELLGDTWRKLYDDEEVERLEQEAFPALESEGYWRGMVTGSRPDGSTFPAALSLTIVGDGRLVCTVRDETERQERRQWRQEFLNSGPLLFVETREVDGEAVVDSCNDRFLRQLGYDRSEVEDEPLASLYTDDSAVSLREGGYEDALAGGPEMSERTLVDADGDPVHTLLRAVPRRDETTGTLALFVDVSEQKEREKRRTARIALLERVYEVTTDSTLGFEEKVDGLLDAGREHLDLPYGFLTQITGADDSQEGTQLIVQACGSHEQLQPGESGPLSRSYCRRNIEQDGLMALTNAAESGWAEDPAYETFDLDTYVGSNVVAGDELFGTLCFASKEPRENPVDEFERSFVDLLARWAGYEIDRRATHEELRQERERLELTLSGTNTGLVEWDLETDAVTWNETLVELVGRDVASIDEFEEAVHPDDRDRVRERIESMLDTGEPWVGEFRILGDEGGVTWIKTRAVVTGDEGDPDRVLATGTDITDQKRAERERRRNERRFRSLLEDPQTLVGLLDTDGTVLAVNGTALSYVDATAEAVRGDRFWETPWWSHSDDLQADLEEWIRRAADGEYVDYEATHPGPDGDTRHVTGTIRPVTDGSGSIESLVVSGRDVTDLKEREQALEASRERYRSLAENIPNGAVLTFDADLEYVLAAGELLAAYGLEESDVAGTNVGELLAGGDHDIVPRFHAALDGERTDRRIELGDRILRIHIVPVALGDEESTDTKGLVLAQDVTDEARRERDLFAERERFRLLTESVDEYAFLVVGEDGTVQTWNDSAAEMFGYDAETAVGMPMARLHSEDDRESGLPERLLQQARVAGESAHEGWRVRADGSEFYADVRHAPLETDDGEFRGYVAIVRDMTDRRRQRRRTERFVEASDDVITVVDTDGTFTYVSGSADRVLGYAPDDLIGENLFDCVHPDGREAAMERFFAGVDDPGSSFDAECRIESGDGRWLNVEGQCRNMLDDDAIGGMLLYLRDVTESKERTRRFESIFNQTYQFTGLLEPDGTVVEVNDAALEFGGFDRDVIVGEPFDDAPWWTHDETVAADVSDALERAADGEFVRYETEVRGASGLAWIDFSVKPVTDEDGDVTLLVVEGRDITDRKRRRQHLEVTQRVLRHNMRNDLTKLRGWTQMMAEETDGQKRAEQFEVVERILDKWDAMSEKMSEIRQILESQQETEVTKRAGSMVEDVVASVGEEYPDATAVTDLSEAASQQVPSTLQDAVVELTSNAAEAGPDVTVEVELSRPGDGWIEICVSDDGPGMPAIEADVLETGEETPLNHGQGLGLWMVRMIVTQAGGDVSVDTGPEGTAVRLLLPTDRAIRTAV